MYRNNSLYIWYWHCVVRVRVSRSYERLCFVSHGGGRMKNDDRSNKKKVLRVYCLSYSIAAVMFSIRYLTILNTIWIEFLLRDDDIKCITNTYFFFLLCLWYYLKHRILCMWAMGNMCGHLLSILNKCIFFRMKINAFQFNELSLKTINFRFSPWFLVPVGLAL